MNVPIGRPINLNLKAEETDDIYLLTDHYIKRLAKTVVNGGEYVTYFFADPKVASIKIGRTKDIGQRQRQLISEYGEHTFMLAYMIDDDREYELHRIFKHLRYTRQAHFDGKTEWFCMALPNQSHSLSNFLLEYASLIYSTWATESYLIDTEWYWEHSSSVAPYMWLMNNGRLANLNGALVPKPPYQREIDLHAQSRRVFKQSAYQRSVSD